MNPYFPHLFETLTVKKTTFKNRIFAAPDSMKTLTDHDYLNNRTIDELRWRAQGGAAAVTYGDGIVHPTGSVDWNPKIRLYEPRCERGLLDYANAIYESHAISSIELNHGGMHLHDDNRINYGPSDMIDTQDQGDSVGKRVHKIHEMPKDVIEEVVDAYGKAALRAKKCGIEMVLVHAGHGWLLSQFRSPVLNRRTDEFGGSPENRARFTTMVLDRIRKYCGPDYPIEVRVCWKEGLTEGYQLEDTIEFCKLLEAHGADLIHISAGSLHYPETTPLTHPGWFDLEEGTNVEAAAEIKKHLHIPVGAVGNISDPHYMERIIAEGKVDYVVVGRALIADPYLPYKAMMGQMEDIRPCTGCLSCHTGGYCHTAIHCSVNPVIGRDDYFTHMPMPSVPKKVLIAGAGPAGMECAITAAERGHEVILCEKRDRLGGILPIIDKEPFKYRIDRYVKYLEHTLRKSKVEIRLNTEVTPELVSRIRPDVLVAAVGGVPVSLSIPGFEKAIPILELYEKEPEIGDRVVVLGGGFAGIECAVGLAMQGKKPVVVEMTDKIAAGADVPGQGTGIIQIEALEMQIKKYGIEVHLNTRCTAIEDNGVICIDKDGKEQKYQADCVVAATGIRADMETVNRLRDCVLDFHLIGDCYRPGLIRTAVRDGFDLALAIGRKQLM